MRWASATEQSCVGGLLVPLGDALVGQDLAQAGMLVVHVSFPSYSFACLFQRSRSAVVVAGELRMALQCRLRIRHMPYAGACRLPIFGRRPRTAAVPLRPVAGDNPGEMGGRVASPTFVGRVEELHVLEAARVRVADGDPAVVLVGGEAGVGKTRLVAELTARCAADGIRVLVGGCVPVGDGALPYAPVVEALRGLLGDVGVAAVRELVGPSWPELARLLPALGEPRAGGGPPDQAAQARLFELLLGLLGRLCEETPLVLVVEDLHWADRSTRDLLAFLVRNLRRERVLLVVTYRSDETGRARLGPFLAELDRAGPVDRIELPRFQRPEVAAQLTGILGEAPAADLVEATFARSEGNPFFTEELLEAVRAGSRELPMTLRDLLLGRITGLPEPARHVLGVAAVAGRPLSHRLLAAVAGLDEPRLDGALRAAVDHQLLVTRHGEDGYGFRHALLQEVVYADLLPGERARVHAALAAALTAQPGWAGGTSATVAAELAYHWEAAGDLERALPAAVQAGTAAERSVALAEAHRHYERALQLWDRVPRAAELVSVDQTTLLERAAEAAHLVDADPRAVERIQAALAGVDPATDPVRAGLLHERLGRYLWLTLDEAALPAYKEAVRLVPAEPESVERARGAGRVCPDPGPAGQGRGAPTGRGGGAGHRPPGRGQAGGGPGAWLTRRRARDTRGRRRDTRQPAGGPPHRRRAGRCGRARLGVPPAGLGQRGSRPAGGGTGLRPRGRRG